MYKRKDWLHLEEQGSASESSSGEEAVSGWLDRFYNDLGTEHPACGSLHSIKSLASFPHDGILGVQVARMIPQMSALKHLQVKCVLSDLIKNASASGDLLVEHCSTDW